MANTVDGNYDITLYISITFYISTYIQPSYYHRILSGKDIIETCDHLIEMMEDIEKQIHYHDGFLDNSQSSYEAELKLEWRNCKTKIRIEKEWVENANFEFDVNMLEKSIASIYKIVFDAEWTATRYYNTYNEISKTILESDKEQMKNGVPVCCDKLFQEIKKELTNQVGLKMLFKLDSELGALFSPRSGKLTWSIVTLIADKLGSYAIDKAQDELLWNYYKDHISKGLKKMMKDKIKFHLYEHNSLVYPKHPENKKKLKQFWQKMFKVIDSLPE